MEPFINGKYLTDNDWVIALSPYEMHDLVARLRVDTKSSGKPHPKYIWHIISEYDRLSHEQPETFSD